MPKIRAAIIGCGAIARHRHAPEYAANPDVEIVAFVDRVHALQLYPGGYTRASYRQTGFSVHDLEPIPGLHPLRHFDGIDGLAQARSRKATHLFTPPGQANLPEKIPQDPPLPVRELFRRVQAVNNDPEIARPS